MYVCLHNCQGSYDALYPNSMSGNPFLDSEMALDIANALQIGEHRVIYQNRCARVGTDDMRASALVREIPLANSQQDIHIYFVLNSRCFTCSLKKALPCTSVWCAESHRLKQRITSDVLLRACSQALQLLRAEYTQFYMSKLKYTSARIRYRTSSMHACARWQHGTFMGLA
jgi:hypothetical protein